MKAIIVGGVAGGAGTAARLRRNNEQAEIIMFEKGPYISFANCGLPYYIGGVITDKDELQLQTPESFHARFNIDVRVQNEVTAIDPQARTVTVLNHATGESYTESYDVLVLSPGARPILPPISGASLPHVFTLRTIPDTYRIKAFIDERQPRRAAIIGSGYIGVEMAENLHQAGVAVAMIEAQNHVIGSLDYDMAAMVHNEIRNNGIALYLESKVVAIDETSLTLEDGRRIEADMVLMSIGVQPETAFIQGSGINLGPRGELLIDDQMRTNLPDVYALGDAAVITHFVSGKQMIIPLASPANKQARLTADIISGKKVRYTGTQGTAIAQVFGQTVAVTGESETSLQRNGIAYRKSYTFSGSNAGYYPGAKTMAIKLMYADNGQILGAQIVGPKGVDKRMDVLATAIRARLTVYDLQELELAYAPPFSSAKDPVNMAGYVAANVLDGMSQLFFPEDLADVTDDDLMLDVRTPGEYKAGHLPNAVNIPVDSLRERLGEIDASKKIFIYCGIGLRGYVAQRILTAHGLASKNLSGGYTLWSALDRDRRAQAAAAVDCTPCGTPQ